MKRIDRSAQIGDGGIAVIHRRVSQMGFVWHERKIDAGIDGEIELRDPATGAVANRILLVQSKASDNRFPGENERSFHYRCDDRDVDYWMQADVPVLLICSHPALDEAWWADVKTWFADPGHRASGRIDFDKATQRFDTAAISRLLDLADPHGTAHTPGVIAKSEVLTSNLLPVAVPDVIYAAATDLPTTGDVFRAQRDTGLPVRLDWIHRAGKVCSWLPPEASGLKAAVTGPTDVIPVADWAQSADPAERRAFVWLLNQALRQDTSDDCDWERDRKTIYFKATPDMKPRSITSSTGRSRLVFNPKYKSDGSGLSYCQHAALAWRFLHVDDQWLCELLPTWHYTRDGHRESLYADKYLSGIKRMEKNQAVRYSTLMWAAYLHGQETMFDERDNLLDYGTLMTFTVDQGVNDTSWAPPSTDDRQAADTAGADDMTLFE